MSVIPLVCVWLPACPLLLLLTLRLVPSGTCSLTMVNHLSLLTSPLKLPAQSLFLSLARWMEPTVSVLAPGVSPTEVLQVHQADSPGPLGCWSLPFGRAPARDPVPEVFPISALLCFRSRSPSLLVLPLSSPLSLTHGLSSLSCLL